MKIVKFVIITTLFIILTGCETHREISDLGMVSAMGIEKIDNKYLISVQVANIKKSTKMGTDNSSKVTLYKGIGKTSFEAIRDVSNKSSKKLYFPHIKLIILSDEIINENPKQIIDFFTRDNEGNMNAYILVSTKNKPSEILSTITSFEDVPAEYIYNSLLLSKDNYGNTNVLTFEDYVNYLIKAGIDPTFTKISLTNNKKIKNNTEILNEIELPTYIKLGNILVFNNKKLTELNEEESMVLNLLKNNSSNSTISLKCDNNKYYTLELANSSSKIDFNSKKDEISINLNLTYNISEYNCSENLLDKQNLNNIKDNISNKIKYNVNSLIKKQIEYKSDFIGFGEIIKSKNKGYFDFNNKNWMKEGLPKLKYKINIEIKLEDKGDLLNRIKKEGKYE